MTDPISTCEQDVFMELREEEDGFLYEVLNGHMLSFRPLFEEYSTQLDQFWETWWKAVNELLAENEPESGRTGLLDWDDRDFSDAFKKHFKGMSQ
jgi:hypothetical protein